MTEHVAFMGLTVDHLYRDCPSMVRAIPHHRWPIGKECRGTVDPEGTDLCGWCQARWRRAIPLEQEPNE